MKAEIVIPVYNEETRLARSMPLLHKFLTRECSFPWRVVIADNGSTDGTGAVAESLRLVYPGVVFTTIAEKGRGGALKRAWLQSDADVLTYMDVDLSSGWMRAIAHPRNCWASAWNV